MHILCPHCKNAIELVQITPREEISCEACGSSFRLETSSTTDHAAAPQTLGRFEVMETVGSGAFGTVYRARDPQLDRVVAVKVPRRDNVGPREQDRDRFLREARSAAQLRHPSIVAVHEVGVADDVTYLVSDFVEGVTLADRLTAGRPAVREAAAIVAAVAEALQYAHEQGVVHRDVKPSNIMLRPDGTPVVMDFGLAKRDAGEITMTVDGQVLGTPAYMSPEQARGEGHRVDGRSDVYSLGVVLYQLLTGELPFRGNTRMLLHQVLHDDPKPPRALNDRLPRDLETVCLKAMAKEPGRRYATAGELADDLRRWLSGEAIRARPVGRVERAVRWARRKPAEAAAAALGVLALAAATAAGVALAYSGRLATAYQEETQAREEAEEARSGEEEQRKAAEAARKVAEVAEGRARDALKQMEQVEYTNSVLIARTAVKEGRDREARAGLSICRPELRGWEWFELQAACHREHLAVNGQSFQFCPTRDEIACGEADGTIRVWDLVSGREVKRIPPGERKHHRPFVYSSDGKRLAAVCSWKEGVGVWEADDGRKLWETGGYGQRVAFSPDGKWVATLAGKGVQMREAESGRELWQAVAEVFNLDSVAFSPDGRRLAHYGFRGLRVWEASNGRNLWKIDNRASCQALAFSPDGKRLAASLLRGNRVAMWDADSGRELWRAAGITTSLVFSPDGDRLAAPGAVWDADSGRELWKTEERCTDVAFSPDGRHLAGSGERGLRVWIAESGRELWKTDGVYGGVAFSPDGRRVGASGQSGVQVWAAEGDRELWKATGRFVGVTFSPDDRRVAACGSNHLQVWEADGGRELWKADGRYNGARFSPDTRHLAAAGHRGVGVWEADRGRELWKVDGAYSVVEYCPDGKSLAAGGIGGGMRVWEASSGREIWRADGHCTSLAFSPDGKRLATYVTPAIQVLEAASGREHWRVADKNYYSHVKFSPDGKYLGAARSDGVTVWAANDGREIMKADVGIIREVAFSPDSKRLAAGGNNGVLLWDLDSGHELWKANGNYISLAFSPDGRCVAAGPNGVHIREAKGGREFWQSTTNYLVMRPFEQSGLMFSASGRLAVTEISDPSGVLHLFSGTTDRPALLGARRRSVHDTRTRWHVEAAVKCEAGSQWFAAAFHWAQHARIDPSQGGPRYRRGHALARLGRAGDAEQEFKAALDLHNTLPPQVVADCHAMLGQFASASKLYQELSDQPAAAAEILRASALLRLQIGDTDGYRAACRTMNQRFGKTKNPNEANTVAWISAVGLGVLSDLKPAINLAQQAVKSAPETWQYHGTLGAVFYRAGQHAEAAAELETAIRMHGKGGSPFTHYFLAMAHHRLGKTDDAKKSLEQAAKLSEQDPPWFWTDKLERQLLRREAEALIGAPAKKDG